MPSLDEEAPLRPVSLYAQLKVRFEELLLARSVALDFTILRFATVYGLSLRPRFDLTINEFARDALLKGELEASGRSSGVLTATYAISPTPWP